MVIRRTSFKEAIIMMVLIASFHYLFYLNNNENLWNVYALGVAIIFALITVWVGKLIAKKTGLTKTIFPFGRKQYPGRITTIRTDYEKLITTEEKKNFGEETILFCCDVTFMGEKREHKGTFLWAINSESYEEIKDKMPRIGDSVIVMKGSDDVFHLKPTDEQVAEEMEMFLQKVRIDDNTISKKMTYNNVKR